MSRGPAFAPRLTDSPIVIVSSGPGMSAPERAMTKDPVARNMSSENI